MKDVTLICQDWGGLTGLPVVADIPDSFRRLVIMNTGLPLGTVGRGSLWNIMKTSALPTNRDKMEMQVVFVAVLPFLMWRGYTSFKGRDMDIKYVFHKQCKFPEQVADAYDAPFPGHLYRGGAAKWPLMVPLLFTDAVTPHMAKAR